MTALQAIPHARRVTTSQKFWPALRRGNYSGNTMQELLVRDVNVPTCFVLDMAALVPYYLRDTVLRLAAYDVFASVLSGEILNELKSALRKLGLSHAQIERVVGAIERTFGDNIWNRHVLETYMREARGCVSDPDDAHVISA